MSNQTIGQFRILSELGRGGMGVVYKGFDETLDRPVAIKVLSDALAAQPEVVQRFKREARAMAALNDRHIVQVFFIGEEGGKPFFAMEYVDGESLGQRLKRDGKLTVTEARRILAETAEGLKVAHARGLIHRDVKPGNLLLDERGRIKIADFGIAMQHDYSDRLTRTGEFVGTPGYLSPEVCTGQEIDARSDIFSLGVVFYEMLTGELPFNEASPLGMMLAVVRADIPDVRGLNKDVDEQTYQILSKMLAKDRDQRFAHCDDLLEALNSEDPNTDFNPAVTSATPPPQAAEPPAAATVAMPTPPPSPLPASPSRATSLVVTDHGKQRPRRLWPAIAALLLLGAGGGAVYALRGAMDGDQSPSPAQLAMVRDATSDTSQTSPVPTVAPTPVAAANPDESATDENEIANEPPPKPTKEELQEALREVGMLGESENLQASATPLETKPEAERFETLGAAEKPEANRADIAGWAAAEPNDARATPPAATTAPTPAPAATTQTLASASSANTRSAPRPGAQPAPTPLSADPQRVLIVASGDPAIADEVERLIAHRLEGERLDILDPGFVPGLDGVVRGNGIDLAALREIALREGVGRVVIAEVGYVGETLLEYYGQQSILYTVNLEVKAVDLVNRKTLPGSWREQVQFTELNAADKARLAVEPHVDAFARGLREAG